MPLYKKMRWDEITLDA